MAESIGMLGASRGRVPASRRLAGIAALYARVGGDLPRFICEGVEAAGTAKQLVAGWQVDGRDGKALIGTDRARELALNLALPFAALRPRLRDRALWLLAELPAAPAYGKTAFLESNLRPASGRRLVRKALEQQGLLWMLGEWCSQGGCGRCALSGSPDGGTGCPGGV